MAGNQIREDIVAPADLERLVELVQAGLGFDFQDRWPELQRHVREMTGALGLATANDCVQWLLTGGQAQDCLDILARQITIGETYFFRDKAIFSLLRHVFFPEVAEGRKSGDRQPVMVWSAGCSSGEEPYSIAVTADQCPALQDLGVRIVATDIHSGMLEKARNGVYTSWSFRNEHPSDLIARYFATVDKNQFQLHETIRQRVTFLQLNLVNPPYPAPLDRQGSIDIIFCRNVFMYFDQRRRQEIVDQFARLLAPGGWLIVGPSETAVVEHQSLARIRTRDSFVFQKKSASSVKSYLLPRPLPGNASEQSRSLPWPVTEQMAAAPRKTEASKKPVPVPSPIQITRAEVEQLMVSAQGTDPEEAVRLLQQLAEDPRPWGMDAGKQEVFSRLASLHADRGEFDRAEKWWRQAIEADKINPNPYYQLALTLQGMDRRADGLTALKKVLFLDPDFLLAHVQIALISENAKEAGRHARIASTMLDKLPPQSDIPHAGGMTAGMIKKALTRMTGYDS